MNGFVLPFLTCGAMSSNPFINNTAGSCEANGFLIDKGSASGCLGFTGLRAYACSVGQIASPPGTSELRYSDYIMADNSLSVTLRFGLGGTDRTSRMTNSYFTAVSRPNCAECYSAGLQCRNLQAIRLLAVTVNG